MDNSRFRDIINENAKLHSKILELEDQINSLNKMLRSLIAQEDMKNARI